MSSSTQPFEFAVQCLHAGRLAEADSLCRQIVSTSPNDAEAWHLRGVIALQLGHHQQAIEYLQQSSSLDASNAEVPSNLGLAYKKMGDNQAAISSFRRAIELQPDFAEAAYNLANCLDEGKQFKEAEALYLRAIQKSPEFADAYLNLANLQSDQGRLDEAWPHYQRSLQLRPLHPETLTGIGLALQRLGKLSDAAACYRQAIAVKPAFFEAYNRLGTCLRLLGLLDDAAACFRHILERQPNHAEALTNLGNTLKDAGDIDGAIECFRQATVSRPDFVPAQSNLLYSLYFSTKYDATTIFAEHAQWANANAAPLQTQPDSFVNDRDPSRPLRIGYVSPYFRDHCQSFFLAPLFRSHDHSKFEIYCYYDDPTSDDLTAFFRSHCKAWRSLVGLTDQAAAAKILEDRIDILVDLTMHMANGRPLLFARKPAPIQVCWLAYPGTTGLPAMDYRLTDPYLDPDCDDRAYSEKSIVLPDAFWCYDPLTSQPAVNELPVLAHGTFTFGCLNNFCKVNDQVLHLWARILRATPNSRLLLLAPDGSHRVKMLNVLENQGISADRITFSSLRPREEYLHLFHQLDLGLDTFPANGHTTTLDFLWMGVPVVTLNGTTAIGRGAASILHNVGHSELVATSPDHYFEIATNLAADRPRLAALRRTLRPRLAASPLMNATLFTKNIETAFRAMWHSWCQKGVDKAGEGTMARD